MPHTRQALLLLLTAFLAVWVALPHTDPDLWGHLVYGERALVELTPQPVDTYSYVARGRRWVNHEWWSEATWAALHVGVGSWSMYALALAMAWAVFGHTLARVDPRAPLLLVAVVGLLAAMSCAHSWAFRPQLFSFGAFYLLALLLMRARDDDDAHRAPFTLLLVPPLIGLWANLHGGFLAGLCAVGLALAVAVGEALLRRRAWRLALLTAGALGAGAACTLITPYGTELWAFLGRSLGQPRPAITEWRSPLRWPDAPSVTEGMSAERVARLVSRHDAEREQIIREWVRGFGALAVGLWLTLRRGPRQLFGAALLLAVSVMWMRHERHLPFVGLTLLAVLPRALRDWDGPLAREVPPDGDAPDSPVLRGSLLLTAAAIIAGGGYLGRHGTPVGTTEYPVAAMRILDDPSVVPSGGGRLISHFNWAQYAIYRLHPHWLVAYDGRFRTVYDGDAETRFMAWNRGQRAWQEILQRAPRPHVALLPPDAPTWRRMIRNGWVVVHEDAACVMMAREGSPTATALRARAAALRADGQLDLPPRVPFPGR